MKISFFGTLCLSALAVFACTPRAVIPDAERERVVKELDGRRYYLRVALNVCPLYGDSHVLLLTDQPTAELDLVRTPGGDTVPAPRAEEILPPGTQVRLEDVEFPSGWTIAKRVVMTPRYHPWAFVEIPGEPRPAVLVLSQMDASFEDVRGEIERVLAPDDTSYFLRALAPDQRQAVLGKELLEGMTVRAVEMSWGLPTNKRVDRPEGAEIWTWAGGRRTAVFQDDKLSRWERK